MKRTIIFIALFMALLLLVSCRALYNDLANEYGGDVNFNTLPTTASTSTSATTTNPSGTTPSGTTSGNDKDDETPEIVFNSPNFTVVDANGDPVKLSDFKGKPIVVNFWTTWCIYCKQEMPDFQTAFEKYPDVQFVMVNATSADGETLEAAKKYISDNNYTFPVFFDTEGLATSAYEITGYPATFFIDANGNLLAYARGMIPLETLEKGIAMINPQ